MLMCHCINCLFWATSTHSITDVTYFENRIDVLMRCSRDKFLPAGIEVTQIVVPHPLRAKLLHIAHDLPTSGHLGIKKTYDRLARHFFLARYAIVCGRVLQNVRNLPTF